MGIGRRTRRTPRFEQDAHARRARAQAHLERRRRANRPAREHRGSRRLQAAAIAAASFAAGALAAGPVWELLASAASPAGLRSLVIQGHDRLAAREIAEAAGVGAGAAPGAALPAVAAALQTHPWIESARVLPAPGGRLLVRVRERVPRALLLRDGSDERLLVDASGTPFAEARDGDAQGLPVLVSARSFARGETDPLLAEGLSLAEALPRRGLDAGAVLALPDASRPAEGWVWRRGEPPLEAVLGEEQLDLRLDRLAALLRARPEAARDARRLDLRFRDRAVLGGRSGSG
jgi:hypothetical protein